MAIFFKSLHCGLSNAGKGIIHSNICFVYLGKIRLMFDSNRKTMKQGIPDHFHFMRIFMFCLTKPTKSGQPKELPKRTHLPININH